MHYGVYQRYYSLQTNSISGCCNDITISWQLFYFWRRVQFLFKERGPLLSFGANCFGADNSNRGPLLISILAQNDVTLFYGVICLSYFFFTTRTTPLVCDYKLACINMEGSWTPQEDRRRVAVVLVWMSFYWVLRESTELEGGVCRSFLLLLIYKYNGGKCSGWVVM